MPTLLAQYLASGADPALAEWRPSAGSMADDPAAVLALAAGTAAGASPRRGKPALRFDGARYWQTPVADPFGLHTTTGSTVVAVFEPDPAMQNPAGDGSAAPLVASCADASGKVGVYVAYDDRTATVAARDDSLTLSLRNGAGTTLNPPYGQNTQAGSAAAGAQHVAVVRCTLDPNGPGSGSRLECLVDHRLRATSTYPDGWLRADDPHSLTDAEASGPLTIGYLPDDGIAGGWVPVTGWLWEVRLYDGALSDAEVGAVMGEMASTYGRSWLSLADADVSVREISARDLHRGFPGHAFVRAGAYAGEHVVMYRLSQAGHNAGDGRLAVRTSRDDYAAEVEIAPGGVILGTAYDVRDPTGLTALADGSLAVMVSVRQRSAPTYDRGTGAGYVTDGITGRLPAGSDPRDPAAWVWTRFAGAQDRWVYSVSVLDERLSDGALFGTMYGQYQNGDFAVEAWRSDDRGATWAHVGTVYRGAEEINECAVVWDPARADASGIGEGHVAYAPGRLLAFVRVAATQDTDVLESYDSGATWGGRTTYTAAAFGHPTLRRMRDGLLVGLGRRDAAARDAILLFGYGDPRTQTRQTNLRNLPVDGQYSAYGSVQVAPDGRAVLLGSEQLNEADAYLWMFDLGVAGAPPVGLGSAPGQVAAPGSAGDYEVAVVPTAGGAVQRDALRVPLLSASP